MKVSQAVKCFLDYHGKATDSEAMRWIENLYG